MRVFCFVDVHGKISKINEIKKKSREADILVCAGDISDFGKDLDGLISRLSKIKKIILIIHGNHEKENELKKVCENYDNVVFIHKKFYNLNGWNFFGYGGGGFSEVDKDLEKLISKVKKGRNVVFVTHAPPYGTKLDMLDKHSGCRSTTKFIKQVKPILTICGHFHENENKEDKINGLKIINPNDGKLVKI